MNKIYSVNSDSLPSRLTRIAEEIRQAGGRCFLVGGWVRDQLLGRSDGRDFDVEVYGLDQETLLQILNRHGNPNLVGKSFGVIHMISKGIHFDFSFPRLESKVGVGHRAFAVETRSDLDFSTAASRRDFSINAMGMELPSLELVDPHGGLEDLRSGLLRHVGPAFAEDSLRVLRGVQFAARFELRIAPETVALCKSLDLHELSKERIFEEFRKWLLKSEHPSVGLHWFVQMDLMRFFPQLAPWPNESWRLLGALLDQIAQELPSDELSKTILMFTGLTSGCTQQKSVSDFMESITQEISLLRGVPTLWQQGRILVEHLTHEALPTDTWLRRFSLKAQMSLALAYAKAWISCDSKKVIDWEQLQSRCAQLDILERAPEPLLTGKMLMDLGYKPGKQFGVWIAQCFEEQLEGYIKSADEALQWVHKNVPKVSESETQ